MMDHISCKCHRVVLRTAVVMLLPFLGPDCWRWSLLCWLHPTGSPALTAHSQIPPALIRRNHPPRSGKISLKYIRTRLATILCSNYSGQRQDRSPRADALGRVGIRFKRVARPRLFRASAYSAGGAILNVCTTYCGLGSCPSDREAVSTVHVEQSGLVRTMAPE